MTQPRYLRLDFAINTRDVGGYLTADGRRTRWRTLLRSANLRTLSATDLERLRRYRLRTLIDLRRDDEVESEPCALAAAADLRYVRVPFGDTSLATGAAGTLGDIYCYSLEQRRAEFRDTLIALATPGTLPALVQCAAGKDRTGTVVALALGCAGVPDDTILADYARSPSPPAVMRQALAYLHERYGGIIGYLNALGFTEAHQAQLRAALTRPRTIFE